MDEGEENLLMLFAFGDLQALHDGSVRIVQDVQRDEHPTRKSIEREERKSVGVEEMNNREEIVELTKRGS